MTGSADRARFRRPPEQVQAEDTVEAVDAGFPHPAEDESEARARMLREAGAG